MFRGRSWLGSFVVAPRHRINLPFPGCECTALRTRWKMGSHLRFWVDAFWLSDLCTRPCKNKPSCSKTTNISG